MKLKKLVSLITVFALLITLFAACGKKNSGDGGNDGKNPDSGTSEKGGTAPGAELEESGTATLEAALASAQKDVINIGIEADITDWAPWAAGSTGRNHAIWGIYQPLIDFDSGEYIPVLLKSYEIAEDGNSIACELWDNIHDSEGNHMTVDDIIFSYKEATEVFPQFDEMIQEIQKEDDYKCTFVLKRPLQVGEMKDLFTSPVVTQASYEKSGDGMHNNPIGTGPYKRTAYTGGYMFTYEKVEDYWQTEDTLQQARDVANVDTINWYVISESSQRTVALEQGTIDMCGQISKEDLDKFNGQNGHQLFSYPDNLSMILFPNCDESSPCSDVNLRRAICYSINSEIILNSVYGGNGTTMYSQVPNWANGYNTAWESEDNYYHYSTEKAADYLAQSSYNNQKLKIICASDENSSAIAQTVQQFLQQVGIESELNPYETSVFSEYIQNPGLWDILIKAQPTSSGFYAQTLHSDFSKTRNTWEGTINFAFDDHLQELIVTCMTEKTSTQDNIDELQQYIVDNCYSMGLVNYWSFVVVPDSVSDICLSYRKTIMPGGCVYTS